MGHFSVEIMPLRGQLSAEINTHISEIIWDNEITEDENVRDEIVDSINNHYWVQREFYRGTESDILRYGWDHFKEVVKHQTRYFFLNGDDEEDEWLLGAEIRPAHMLDAIAHVITTRLEDFDIIKTVPTTTNLIRLRVDKGKRHKTAKTIGTTPAQFANQSNRMSPAGVPMFYGAFDHKTAMAETYDPKVHEGVTISAGTFNPVRPLVILDLANLPLPPSIYDEDRRHLIHSLWFLHEFARDISKPIARDGREHIEYVPTQIVTEYFRRAFKRDGQHIDGLSYRSSKNRGREAFVLFCENEQCIEADDTSRHWLYEPLVRLRRVSFKKPK